MQVYPQISTLRFTSLMHRRWEGKFCFVDSGKNHCGRLSRLLATEQRCAVAGEEVVVVENQKHRKACPGYPTCTRVKLLGSAPYISRKGAEFTFTTFNTGKECYIMSNGDFVNLILDHNKRHLGFIPSYAALMVLLGCTISTGLHYSGVIPSVSRQLPWR